MGVWYRSPGACWLTAYAAVTNEAIWKNGLRKGVEGINELWSMRQKYWTFLRPMKWQPKSYLGNTCSVTYFHSCQIYNSVLFCVIVVTVHVLPKPQQQIMSSFLNTKKSPCYLYQEDQMLIGMEPSKQLKAGYPCLYLIYTLEDELDFESQTVYI